jgi:hypothetical protein
MPPQLHHGLGHDRIRFDVVGISSSLRIIASFDDCIVNSMGAHVSDAGCKGRSDNLILIFISNVIAIITNITSRIPPHTFHHIEHPPVAVPTR